METFSALLALCAGNSPVTGEFPAQRPVTRCFDIFFDLRLNKRLSKQSWGWWFETPSRPLWRHCNELGKSVSDFAVITVSADVSAPLDARTSDCTAMSKTRQNGRKFCRWHFQMHILEWKYDKFRLKFHWRLFLRVQLTIFQHWFR